MEARNWEDLDEDCLAEVFEKVGLQHLLWEVPLVCKSWYKASLNPKCWKFLDFQSVRDYQVCFGYDDTKLIQFAVTRSAGTAAVIKLSDYCTMEGLKYIATECRSLKGITLRHIQATQEEMQGIPQLISEFKELEFLRVTHGFDLKDIVTEIGTNCPNFAGLGASNTIDIEMASAFVHFLPKIKYLVLRGVYMHREALVHILRGCRDLVFLNVSDCLGFDEDDVEILELASHIKTFMSKGSKLEDDDDYLNANDFEDFTGNGSD